MANTVIGASVEIEFQSVGNMRKALKEANAELLAMQDQFGAASQQAISAARKVADLKDRIQDARETADLFDPGKKFQAFVTLGSQIAAGFSAVQGAMALVGSESEDVEKALLKVQSAMALAQGLSELKDFGKSWQQLNVFIQSSTILQKANAAATALTTKTMKLFGVAVNSTSTSFRVLKTAIISTGIGALLVLLGEAVSAVMEWTSSTNNQAKAEEELKKREEDLKHSIDQTNDSIQRRNEIQEYSTNLAIATAKAQGKSIKEIRDIEKKAALEKRNLAQDDEAAAQNRLDRLKEDLKFGIQVSAEELKIAQTDLDAKKKIRENAFQAERILEQNHIAAVNEENKNANKKRQDEIDQNNKIKKEKLNAALELEKKIEEDFRKSRLSERNKELFEIEKTYQEQKKILEAAGRSTVQLTEFYNQQRAAINKKYDDINAKAAEDYQNKVKELVLRKQGERVLSEQEQARQAVIDKYAKEREELANQYPNNLQLQILLKQNEQAELDKLDSDFEQKKRQQQQENARIRIESERAMAAELIAVETELQNQKMNVVNTGLDLLQQLAGKNEKIANIFFAIQKAIEIGRIITSTASSISLIKAQTAAIPVILPPGVPNPAYFTALALNTKRIISLKLGAAANIAQIAAASIAKFKGGGQAPSGGGGGEVGAPPTIAAAPIQPQLSPAVQGQALNAEAINALGNTAIRAYVTNSDLQNNQQRNAYLERNARIG